MISATDSFVNYLSTRLDGIVPVVWVRVTPDAVSSLDLQMDALNFSILQFSDHGSMESILVSLDLIGSDERTSLQIAKKIRLVLSDTQYTSELDYEIDPDAPASLGRNVEWQGNEIVFSLIISRPNYFHLNSTFAIRHAWK